MRATRSSQLVVQLRQIALAIAFEPDDERAIAPAADQRDVQRLVPRLDLAHREVGHHLVGGILHRHRERECGGRLREAPHRDTHVRWLQRWDRDAPTTSVSAIRCSAHEQPLVEVRRRTRAVTTSVAADGPIVRAVERARIVGRDRGERCGSPSPWLYGWSAPQTAAVRLGATPRERRDRVLARGVERVRVEVVARGREPTARPARWRRRRRTPSTRGRCESRSRSIALVSSTSLLRPASSSATINASPGLVSSATPTSKRRSIDAIGARADRAGSRGARPFQDRSRRGRATRSTNGRCLLAQRREARVGCDTRITSPNSARRLTPRSLPRVLGSLVKTSFDWRLTG